MGRARRPTANAPLGDLAWRDLEGAGLRVLSGRRLGFRQRKAGLAALASDIDEDSGVAAVWLVQHAGSAESVQHMLWFEGIGGWRCLGGGSGGSGRELSLAGRPSASLAGPAAMLTPLGECSGRSLADREALGREPDFAHVGWVASAGFRCAAEVAYVLAGPRRIKVPGHGYVIVAWKAPPRSGPPRRPLVVAVAADGSRLTELGSGSYVDSLTWAAVEAAIVEE